MYYCAGLSATPKKWTKSTETRHGAVAKGCFRGYAERLMSETEQNGGIRILLGVTGGVAAYKSPELVRRLREKGAQVQVVMTPGAGKFVSPLTFQAVSGRRVRDDLWDEGA